MADIETIGLIWYNLPYMVDRDPRLIDPKELGITQSEPQLPGTRGRYRMFALKAKGFIPLSIKAKSFAQVVEERPSHFWKGELGYLNDRINNPYSDLREYTPP